jgi:hypothetical protein
MSKTKKKTLKVSRTSFTISHFAILEPQIRLVFLVSLVAEAVAEASVKHWIMGIMGQPGRRSTAAPRGPTDVAVLGHPPGLSGLPLVAVGGVFMADLVLSYGT